MVSKNRTRSSVTTPASAATAVSSSAPSDGNGFPVNRPPQVAIPPVPEGFVPIDPLDVRGWYPMQSELAAVPDAIADLDGFVDYTALFGITAPPAALVSARLSAAAGWTTLYASTIAWCEYVRSQQGVAWREALELVDELKAPFRLAAARNPALLAEHVGLVRILEAKRLAAKRGVSTRARNAKAAYAASVADATALPPPAAPQPATAPATPPARVVTIEG
jgi:hypothetical protein